MLRSCFRLIYVAVVLCACGGKSDDNKTNAQGGSAESSGGHGSDGGASGGATPTSPDAGGAPSAGTASGAGGTRSPSDCAKTTCPAIPNSCKKLVQDPAACCPVCEDSGCGECPVIDCAAGTHGETLVGDCCPTCVADPPDRCVQGQKSYAELRAQLLEKYGSSGCKNSSDCALVLEDSACGYVCNTALPAILVDSFVANLQSAGEGDCATCPAPSRNECVPLFPACVNGKCVGVPPR